MEFLPGPDFPTGAIIQGKDEIRKAYETGKGRVVVRSRKMCIRDRVWAALDESEKAKRPYPLISGDVGPYAAYLANGSEYTGCLLYTSK